MKEKMVVKKTAQQVYKKKLMTRFASILAAFLLLFLAILYSILYIINNEGNFTIALDPNLMSSQSIVMSKNFDFNDTTLLLETDALHYMDNITEAWLPDDIDDIDGQHNGNNYMAYTFYIKNKGETMTNYMVTVDIISVIKNVDEAVRVAVYLNGEKTVYAKQNKNTGEPEPNTVAFVNESQVMKNSRSDFEPGSIDKYTIVIWLEGNDPECVDNILGGEMKMKMSFGEDRQ